MGNCQAKDTQFDFIRKAEADMKKAASAFAEGAEDRAKSRLESALEHLNAAVALCASYPMSYYLRAKVFLLLGRLKEGIQDCETCHTLMPELWGAYFLQAECHEAADEADVAAGILAKIPKKIRESRAQKVNQRQQANRAAATTPEVHYVVETPAGFDDYAQVWPVALAHPNSARARQSLRRHVDVTTQRSPTSNDTNAVALAPTGTPNAPATAFAQWLPVDESQSAMEPPDRFVEARKQFIESMKRERNYKRYKEYNRHMFVKTPVEKREMELRNEQKQRYSTMLADAMIRKSNGYAPL